MFKNLIFFVLGVVVLFVVSSCGDSKSIDYEDIKKDSLRVEKLGQGTVRISWDDTKGAVYYEIKYKKYSFRSEEISEMPEFPSIVLDGLEENIYWTVSVRASTSKKWISIVFMTNIAKPELSVTPTNSVYDTIEIELSGEVGTKVFIDDVDSGNVIKSNGRIEVILNTPAPQEACSCIFNFQIHLEDESGNKSDILELTITRDISLIHRTETMAVVSGNYDRGYWNEKFSNVMFSDKNEWSKLREFIDFNHQATFYLGTKDNLSKHKNSISTVIKEDDESFFHLIFYNSIGQFIHFFHFDKDFLYDGISMQFDGKGDDIIESKFRNNINGIIRVKNNQLEFIGDSNKVLKSWYISDFNNIKTIQISMGILHKSDEKAYIPLYIDYYTQPLYFR